MPRNGRPQQMDPLEALMGPMGAAPGGQDGMGMSPPMEDTQPPGPMPGMDMGMEMQGGIPGVKPGAEGRFMELIMELGTLLEQPQGMPPQGPPGMGPGGPPGMGPGGPPGGGQDPLAALLGGGGAPRPPRR